MADQYAKDAATGRARGEELLGGYAEETSLAHMTRVATEASPRRRQIGSRTTCDQDNAIDHLLARALGAPS